MTTPRKNSHCSYCGQAFAEDQPWPRWCAGCRRVSYLNPLPVAVLLVPVDGGLLCVRRAIEPGKGLLALPGGFIDIAETWQEAAVRELREETGMVIDPNEVREFRVLSSRQGDGVILIFGLAQERRLASLPPFRPNDEVSACVVLREAQELAFPLHTQVMREFFGRQPATARVS